MLINVLISNCFLLRNVISALCPHAACFWIECNATFTEFLEIFFLVFKEEQQANYRQIMFCCETAPLWFKKKYDNWHFLITLTNNKDYLNWIKDVCSDWSLTNRHLKCLLMLTSSSAPEKHSTLMHSSCVVRVADSDLSVFFLYTQEQV